MISFFNYYCIFIQEKRNNDLSTELSKKETELEQLLAENQLITAVQSSLNLKQENAAKELEKLNISVGQLNIKLASSEERNKYLLNELKKNASKYGALSSVTFETSSNLEQVKQHTDEVGHLKATVAALQVQLDEYVSFFLLFKCFSLYFVVQTWDYLLLLPFLLALVLPLLLLPVLLHLLFLPLIIFCSNLDLSSVFSSSSSSCSSFCFFSFFFLLYPKV